MTREDIDEAKAKIMNVLQSYPVGSPFDRLELMLRLVSRHQCCFRDAERELIEEGEMERVPGVRRSDQVRLPVPRAVVEIGGGMKEKEIEGIRMVARVGGPWKRRAVGMKCRTCMWFAPRAVMKTRSEGASEFAAEGLVGRCRRHAPALGGYPAVFSSDWCGDHKLDEEKS
uniref:Uncharacterized protein n=1 Tax=viral metagenome TaxID=1070528 RepID=A0A6M3J9Z7_9ZZZZ